MQILSYSRVGLKIAFRQMCVTVCGTFVPNPGYIACYVPFIRDNASINRDVYLTESNFQIHSITTYIWRPNPRHFLSLPICDSVKACLKIHFRHLHAPLCGIFVPNSGYIARDAPFIRDKSPANSDAHLTESNFQTHSKENVPDFVITRYADISNRFLQKLENNETGICRRMFYLP